MKRISLAGSGAEAVRDAIAEAISSLPEPPRRSLKWDQTNCHSSRRALAGLELDLSRDVDLLRGAGFEKRSRWRVDSRSGQRTSLRHTRSETIGFEIPKLRKCSYLPSPRHRQSRPA